MSSSTVLDQGVGYGVVVGVGGAFTVLMIIITKLQARYTNFDAKNNEEFTSASRSVKPGLIASGIVSAWTWAATLLQSSAMGYKTGLSGPYWYASGATVQVLLFSMNAAKLKMNAPFAHTPFEIVRKRWGTFAHVTFLFFALSTNVIVSSMLILGSSATITDLTGASTLAVCFLIPIVVAGYVVIGGMRATLLCDYTHTTILFAIILAFMFCIYATTAPLGSPRAMYDLLQQAQATRPVTGNAQGSYLTLSSKPGGIFGIINVIGNFGTVYLDQAYWQRAVASKPSSAVKGYLMGGLAWFSVPFGMATACGLAAVALTPYFPNGPLTADQVGAGLPAPTAIATLLGKSGATTILVLLFLAVTSATSAELIAVSSVVTYDIYLPYINPHAGEREVFWVSHAAIGAWTIIMGLLGLIFFYIGVSMGWLYEFMGVFIGSAVCPLALVIMSRRANKWGCVGGSIAGLCLGLMSWLVATAKLNDGVINVNTTFQDYPMLTGNLVAIGVGAIVSVVATLIWPENYKFVREYRYHATSGATPVPVDSPSLADGEEYKDDKATSSKVKAHASVQEAVDEDGCAPIDDPELDLEKLSKSFRMATIAACTLFVVLLLVIPFPLVFSKHIYNLPSFTAWIAVAFIWAFIGAFIVVLYPIYESRTALHKIGSGIWKDLTGGKRK